MPSNAPRGGRNPNFNVVIVAVVVGGGGGGHGGDGGGGHFQITIPCARRYSKTRSLLTSPFDTV